MRLQHVLELVLGGLMKLMSLPKIFRCFEVGMKTVKFSNGNILTIHDSGGHRIFNMIKPNEPAMRVVGYGYVFNKNMVYRKAIPQSR